VEEKNGPRKYKKFPMGGTQNQEKEKDTQKKPVTRDSSENKAHGTEKLLRRKKQKGRSKDRDPRAGGPSKKEIRFKRDDWESRSICRNFKKARKELMWEKKKNRRGQAGPRIQTESTRNSKYKCARWGSGADCAEKTLAGVCVVGREKVDR